MSICLNSFGSAMELVSPRESEFLAFVVAIVCETQYTATCFGTDSSCG